MDAQTLITSGKLELYVAGSLSEREMMAVAAYALEYPQVAYEIQKIEETLVKYLGPPASLSEEKEDEIDRLLARIHREAQAGKTTGRLVEEGRGEPLIAAGRMRPWIAIGRVGSRWLMAAVIIGLILMTGATIRFGAENRSLHDQMALQRQQFVTQRQQLGVMRNILTRRVELTAVSGNKITGKDNYLLVYWNPSSQKWVLADANLPGLSNDRQYQLWALYDGKPIDAGLFDADKNHFNVGFQKDVPNAQAFAVTVEPRGGSKSPTLSNLCLMAKL